MDGFTRQITFTDSVVPDCYAHLLTHNGGVYPPNRCLFVTYRKDDFLNLCRQELETASPYLLDKPDRRHAYRWFKH